MLQCNSLYRQTIALAAKLISYSSDYYQRLTLESWFTRLRTNASFSKLAVSCTEKQLRYRYTVVSEVDLFNVT